MSSSDSDSSQSSSDSDSDVSSSEETQESESRSPRHSSSSLSDDKDDDEEPSGDGNLIYRPRKEDLEELHKSVDNDREIYRPSKQAPSEPADADESGSDDDGDCSDDDSTAASCAATTSAASSAHPRAPDPPGSSRPATAGRRKRKARVTVNLEMCDYTVITKASRPSSPIAVTSPTRCSVFSARKLVTHLKKRSFVRVHVNARARPA
jgi:hypothetical protein